LKIILEIIWLDTGNGDDSSNDGIDIEGNPSLDAFLAKRDEGGAVVESPDKEDNEVEEGKENTNKLMSESGAFSRGSSCNRVYAEDGREKEKEGEGISSKNNRDASKRKHEEEGSPARRFKRKEGKPNLPDEELEEEGVNEENGTGCGKEEVGEQDNHVSTGEGAVNIKDAGNRREERRVQSRGSLRGKSVEKKASPGSLRRKERKLRLREE
jgi:hypothetical protein